jgi:hypothetical protein
VHDALRHAAGKQIDKGHGEVDESDRTVIRADTRAILGWLGHRSITSTAVYAALAPNRFRTSGGSEP